MTHLSLFLWDHRYACRTNAGELDNHLTILGPGIMRCLRWFGEKRPHWIRPHLALIPLFANREIIRSRQDRRGAHLVGVPMRHDLRTGRILDAYHIHARLGGVPIQYRGLQAARAHGRLKHYLIRKFDDALGTLGVSLDT